MLLSTIFGTLLNSGLLWDLEITDKDHQQLNCMTEAIYFEAGGESIQGKIAVGSAIMNRVRDQRHPATVCEVVGKRFQFSYRNESVPSYLRENNKLERDAYKDSFYIAALVLKDLVADNTNASTNYYNITAIKDRPSWIDSCKDKRQIEKHTYCKADG